MVSLMVSLPLFVVIRLKRSLMDFRTEKGFAFRTAHLEKGAFVPQVEAPKVSIFIRLFVSIGVRAANANLRQTWSTRAHQSKWYGGDRTRHTHHEVHGLLLNMLCEVDSDARNLAQYENEDGWWWCMWRRRRRL
jgi:hypothetical protein